MKKMFPIILLTLLFYIATNAQVKIGGTPVAPVASAVLELDGGSNRGLLLPRMRKLDIDAIQNPAEGLTIYATDEQAMYLRRSGNWVKLSGGEDAFSLPYFKEFNHNGTIFRIHNEFDNSTSISGYNFGNNGIGVRGYSLKGEGFYGSAQDSTEGIGGFFINNKGGRSLISMNKTGIGTKFPIALLHVDGTSTPGSTVLINDDAAATIQLRNEYVNKGYLQADVNDMVMATNISNANGKIILRTNDADRLIVDNNGNTGIGAPSIGARLYVDAMATSATAMVLNDQSPTLQLQNAGVDKGFMQVVGNDLRLGTNAANTSGHIIMRTKGTDRMRVDSNGRVSIGVGNYDQDVSPLNIHGLGIKIDGDGNNDSGPYLLFTRTSANNEVPVGIITFNQSKMRFAVSNRGYEFSDLSGNEYLSMQPTTGYTNVHTRLGVSTDNPTAKFFINGIDDAATAMVINDNDPLIQLQQTGVSKGYIQVDANDMVLATNIANNTGKVALRTNNVNRLLVNPDGRIIVGSPTGTSPAGSQLLKIRGGIQATDFTVTALAAWPDYVFADDYKLKSLEETETFIKANKHLPNIPAAAVIEKDGFALGEMQKRMMEKIEELTLHLIEANKEIKTLKKQMAAREK